MVLQARCVCTSGKLGMKCFYVFSAEGWHASITERQKQEENRHTETQKQNKTGICKKKKKCSIQNKNKTEEKKKNTRKKGVRCMFLKAKQGWASMKPRGGHPCSALLQQGEPARVCYHRTQPQLTLLRIKKKKKSAKQNMPKMLLLLSRLRHPKGLISSFCLSCVLPGQQSTAGGKGALLCSPYQLPGGFPSTGTPLLGILKRSPRLLFSQPGSASSPSLSS